MPIIDKIQLSGTVYTIGSENSGVTSGEVQTMIDNSLSGYVYTADNGKQDIYGSKTFIGEKRISFTQGTSSNKPGFTIYGVRDAEGNASQLGTFELNPTAITESNTTFPLLSLGHYRSGNRRASVQTYIGFRQYDYDNSAAYHLLAPLPQNAKTPFSLTTSFQNFYMPLGIKVDNSTMVKADSGGVMDISSYIGGGGKAVSGGTNISITTGETADTINCTLPYYKLSGEENYSIYGQSHQSFINKASYAYQSIFIGFSNEVKGNSASKSYASNTVVGNNNIINGYITNYSQGNNVVIGDHNRLSGTNLSNSYVIGKNNSGYTSNTLLTGWYNQAHNGYESSFGKYNASNTGSTDADKSLFTVGNGTADNARHNAFEIRQNGDIYLTKDGQDVKLQDQLGGGGSSYTAGDGIDITNDVISVTGKVDTSAITTSVTSSSTDAQVPSAKAVYDALQEGGGVNVVQTTGTSTTDVMSQDAVTTQLNNKANKSAAFGGYKFGSTNNANYLQYTNVNNDNIGNSIYYPKINGKGIFTNNNIYAQNNYDFQLVETSAITTSITSSSTDAQVPSAKAVNDKLGGLSLVKLTQAEYDALATKDSNVLYVIVG